MTAQPYVVSPLGHECHNGVRLDAVFAKLRELYTVFLALDLFVVVVFY